jgi:hypothetical protein
MKACQHCGTKNPDDAVFCSECGKKIEGQAPAVSPAKTILSTPAPRFEKREADPAPTAKASPAPAPEGKKTIMGMPSPGSQTGMKGDMDKTPAEPIPAAMAPAAKAAKAKAPSAMDMEKAKKAAQEAAGKTMLGVSPLAAASSSAAAKKPDVDKAKKAAQDVAGKTMLGVSPLASASREPAAKGGEMVEQPVPRTLGSTAKEEKPVFEPMDDMPVMTPSYPPPKPQPVSDAVPASRPAASEPDRPSGRHRAEAPAEGIKIDEPIHPAPSSRARPPAMSMPSRPSRIGATTMLMMKKAAASPRWLIVLIIVVVVGGAGIGFLIKKYVIEPLRPRVTKIIIRQNPDFQSVDLELTMVNVEKAKVLQIKNQKFEIKKSKASVNLPIGPVRLGENSIEAALLDAAGKEKGTIFIEFELTKFWQPQLQTLEESNPVIGLYFQTLPDARLTINGEPSPGEGPGKFLYQKSIKELVAKYPPTEEETWKLSFDYELSSKGREPEKGNVGIEVPAAKLQVDRPGDGARLVEDKVECTGKTELDAEIKINGTPVDVNGGKFATTIPLPEFKTYTIEVVAISPKRGPKKAVVKVERVEDMSAEIDAYKESVDADLSWEKLARDPTTYTGKKVAFDGRIFNIRAEKGVTAFQMLVSEGCPDGARCTLVATFRGETSAGEQSLVTVLGEVRGVQTLQTATGTKFDAPQIEAAYVIPAEQEKKKKK